MDGLLGSIMSYFVPGIQERRATEDVIAIQRNIVSIAGK